MNFQDNNQGEQDSNSVVNTDQSLQETISLSKGRIILAKKILNNLQDNLKQLQQLLDVVIDPSEEAMINIGQLNEFLNDSEQADGNIAVEGVFDGEKMIGPDGRQYSVPANYASKSKLVEGDMLKLIITEKGTFIYKQISPIERLRLVGSVEKSTTGEFNVLVSGRRFRVLTASVTFFKGEVGDEAVILIPKTGESRWAAIENIVKKNSNFSQEIEEAF